MPKIKVKKTRDYTVMSNHHLRNHNLTLRAKGLLSLMLSLPESWDYSLQGLAQITKEGVSAVTTAMKELEQEGYVIRNRIRNEKGQLTDTEYIIYENPISKPPILENPILDKPEQEQPILEKCRQSNTKEVITNKVSKDVLNINPSIPQWDMIDRRNAITELFKDNIDYATLCTDHGKECIDELLDILVETYCSTRQTVHISDNDIPLNIVRGKLMKLASQHIRYVLLSLSKNTTKVHNIKSYLLACLYNSLSTVNHYYQAEVTHDLYGTPSYIE